MDFQTIALIIIGIIVFFVVLGIVFRLAKFIFQMLSLVLLFVLIAVGIVSFFSIEPLLLPSQDMTVISYTNTVVAYRYVNDQIFIYDLSTMDTFILMTFRDNLSGLRDVIPQIRAFSQSDSIILLGEPCAPMSVSCVEDQLSLLHIVPRMTKDEPISHVLLFRRSLWFRYFLASIDWN